MGRMAATKIDIKQTLTICLVFFGIGLFLSLMTPNHLVYADPGDECNGQQTGCYPYDCNADEKCVSVQTTPPRFECQYTASCVQCDMAWVCGPPLGASNCSEGERCSQIFGQGQVCVTDQSCIPPPPTSTPCQNPSSQCGGECASNLQCKYDPVSPTNFSCQSCTIIPPPVNAPCTIATASCGGDCPSDKQCKFDTVSPTNFSCQSCTGTGPTPCTVITNQCGGDCPATQQCKTYGPSPTGAACLPCEVAPPPQQGQCSTDTLGDCDVCPLSREKCIANSLGTPTCMIVPGSCGQPSDTGNCGDPGTIGECGAPGGCSYENQRCEAPGNCVPDNECVTTGGTPQCVPAGGLCGSSSPSGTALCCGAPGVPCAADSTGAFRCGWPPAPDIPTYRGPIVEYEKLLKALFSLLLPIAVGVAGIPLIIINGYKIMTSQGNPAAVQDGKEGLTSAIIGLLFVLLALVIIRVIISSLFGLSI